MELLLYKGNVFIVKNLVRKPNRETNVENKVKNDNQRRKLEREQGENIWNRRKGRENEI